MNVKNEELPVVESVTVDGVEIEYADTGAGSPIVFVHGVYVTGALWDDLGQRLATDHRCIAPTWPFGAQSKPVGPGTDIGVTAAGKRLVGLLERLDLSDVTLVSNDTGGGIVLSALGDRNLDFTRVSRLVFTNCDSFDHFPPPGFMPLVKMCRLNPMLGRGVLRLLSSSPGLNYFTSSVTRHGIPAERRREIFGGFAASAKVRADAVRLSAQLSPDYTMAAVPAINAWEKPVLVLWGDSDNLFPMEDAQRLAEAFPNATLQPVEDSSTYVMLDQPDAAAAAIRSFVDSTPSETVE